MPLQAQEDAELSMVLVMGVTGSGKSFLINKLVGKDVVRESANMDSCMYYAMRRRLDPARPNQVLLVDTPGFDDTHRSESEILEQIAKALAAQYALGMVLKGIIYLHRNNDIRMQGSSMKALQIFKKLVGDEAFKNVVLATTRWDLVGEDIGSEREQELHTKFWAYMMNKGATMTRFYGDRASATRILSQLLAKKSIILDIQREMVDENRPLNKTSAGAIIDDGLAARKAEYEQGLRDLEDLRRTLLKDDREMRRQIQRDWEKEKTR
ncbi:MAG: gTPase, IMAP member 8 [Icmadophila ericetorum]|nr:gTPase, IMAP member 8 [Icmadophila ericetorum]